MTRKNSKGDGVNRLRAFAENCGAAALVSILVSGVVSGFIGYHFSAKLEGEKEKVAELVRYKDQIDASQNSIVAQLALYADRLTKNKEAAKIEDLQSTIVTAQLQINRLRSRLRPEDQAILAQYEAELGNLLKYVRSSPGPNEMVPVIATVQRLLEIHDKFAERVRGNIKTIL